MTENSATKIQPATVTRHPNRRVPLFIASGAVPVVLMGVLLVAHATATVNRVALARSTQ
jgi:hypothetical protein